MLQSGTAANKRGFGVALTDDRGFYALDDDGTDLFTMSDTRRDVFLAVDEGKSTPAEIQEHTGLNKDDVKQQLSKLVKHRKIQKVSRGVYEPMPEQFVLTRLACKPAIQIHQ